MKAFCCIYKTTNLINGKVYVGRQYGNNKYYLGSGVILKQAIKKHGIGNFKRENLEECSPELLNEREIYWIAFFDSTNPEVGYNISEGGGGAIGVKKSNATIEKIRLARLGVNHTEETKGKIAGYRVGKNHSQETRTKISSARKGKIKHTEQHKEKIRNTLLGNERPLDVVKKIVNAKLNEEKVTCPHCNKTMSRTPATRYHFDKCKFK